MVSPTSYGFGGGRSWKWPICGTAEASSSTRRSPQRTWSSAY